LKRALLPLLLLLQEAQVHGSEGWRVLDQLAAAASGSSVTRKALTPSEAEVAANPRSRSAKLRVFQKAGGPAGVVHEGRGSRRSSSSSSSRRSGGSSNAEPNSSSSGVAASSSDDRDS
jgi:hypothetical protein